MNDKTIAVYTIMLTLRLMRKQLGLEATLEFMDKYTEMIERTSPEVLREVRAAIEEKSIENLYAAIAKGV